MVKNARPTLEELRSAPPIVRRLEVAQIQVDAAERTASAIVAYCDTLLQMEDISAEEIIRLRQQLDGGQ